ncbi:MAG: HD-GYP domain-containing protein, partial [Longimicrobiales bacterium]
MSSQRPPGEGLRARDVSPLSARAHARFSSSVQYVRQSDVIASLSYALDLTEGQPPGHTLRSCAIGMRLGEELGLPVEQKSALYYALLLKDAGCSTNSSALSKHFESDDQRIKKNHKITDWTRTAQGAYYVWRSVGQDQDWLQRLPLFLRIAFGKEFNTHDLIRVRCERGAGIAARLGFPEETADAIRALDEHWNGAGQPNGLTAQSIPLLGRIAGLAQTVEVFVGVHGLESALEMLRRRSGRWFDPELARRVRSWRNDVPWWKRLYGPELNQMIQSLEPADRVRTLNEHALDQIAEAFAEIIDAKSPYTFRHSTTVAYHSRAIARAFGMSSHEVRRIYRAALLHDIGKLGISNLILDKPSSLSRAERAQIQRHPEFTWDILKRVSAFEEFAWTASLHHERLDGSGYPWKVKKDKLDQSARIIAVADVYEALTAARPYRPGLSPSAAMGVLHRDSGTVLDA